MIIYTGVTEQNMIKITKLEENEVNQKATQIKKKFQNEVMI